MYCCGFVKNNQKNIILSCCEKLVSYYLSKEFVIIEINKYALTDVPLHVKQQIITEKLHQHYHVIA